MSKNHRKNICAGLSFLKKIQAGCLQLYYKETPVLVLFVNSAKFLRTLILENVCERLLLKSKIFTRVFA